MEEEDLHFYILIDNSLSMDFGTPTKLHYAKQVAAALGFIGLVNLDRVVIEAFNDRLTQTHAGRARPAEPVAAARLPQQGRAGRAQRPARRRCGPSASSAAARASSSCSATSWTRAATRKRCAISIARQLDIYVIQILSQEEIEPEIVGDLKLVDVEDDDVAEITVSGPLLKRYKQNLAAYRAALHEFCTRRGVTYLFTSNQVPFDRLVLTYLRQRGTGSLTYRDLFSAFWSTRKIPFTFSDSPEWA